MGDRTVAVKLTLRNEGFVAGLRQAKAQSTDWANSVQEGAKRNKGSLDTVARGLGVVGLAAGAVGILAVKSFADFDAAMSGVQAATHETAGNMQALRDAAVQAGKDTSFSATEAAGAIENLAKAGVSTKDILAGGLKGALDLASAGSLDVGDAAEIAATALTQFRLSGAQVPHVADLLAAAAGKAQGEVSDVAMALKQGGLVAAQFGLSIEETTGTIAAFASAGLIGSDAGTSFKTMLLALANPSAKAAGELERLGIAAYDTKGNFVGIAPLAEQLKTKLQNLTPAQRDAALATIFGSDAIRAANVLYQNGAKGISEWTTKVNDQGYAAETAALKTDNLKGDLERLGGAIDTALIQSGEGANGMLRSLVKSADGAVSAFSDLPGWVQKGALALTGLVGAGALGAAGLIKGVQAAAELRGALQKLNGVSSGLKFGLGGVGIALAAAAAVFGIFAKESADSKRHVQEFRDTLDQATGALTQNTRAYVANELAQNGLSQKAKDLGLNLSTVTDAALGNSGALGQVAASLDAVITAGTTVANTGKSGMITTFSDSAKAAQDLKQELLGMNSNLTEAQKQALLAAEGAKENKSAQELTAEATKAATEAFQAEAASLSDTIEKMHQASGAALELSGAQIGVEQAIDDLIASVKENGKTYDITTQKGRDNQKAVNALADAYNTQTDEVYKSSNSNVVAAKSATASRESFEKLLIQMGKTPAQARAMAKSLIDIPNVDRKATLTANITDLESKLATAKTKLKDPKLTATQRAKLEAYIKSLEDNIAKAKRDLASVPPSKTVTITTVYKTVGSRSSGSGSGGGHINEDNTRASGGSVEAGRMYKVGEEGPEYWVAPANGTILTASQTRQIDAARFTQSSISASSGAVEQKIEVAPPSVRVFIGNEEITDRMQIVVDSNNRKLKRNVRQGVVT